MPANPDPIAFELLKNSMRLPAIFVLMPSLHDLAPSPPWQAHPTPRMELSGDV
jgi:hypothetical protein